MQIKEYRIKRGLSQQQIADMLGINQPTYNRKEKGHRSFTVDELLMLEIIFDASISDMFKDAKEEAKNKLNRG